MNYYSQRDSRWRYKKLGFGNTTIGKYGCKLTSFSCIDGRDPIEMNQLFKDTGAFIGDLLWDEVCARSLGWEFHGRIYKDPKELCIAEVDFNPDPDKDQHFVVWLGNGRIVDPWNGMEMDNPYKVISYRLFKIKDTPMAKVYHIDNKLEDVLRRVNKKFDGDNEDSHEKMAKELDEELDRLEVATKTVDDLVKAGKKLEETVKLQRETIEELEKDLENCEPDIEKMTIGQLIKQIIKIITGK